MGGGVALHIPSQPMVPLAVCPQALAVLVQVFPMLAEHPQACPWEVQPFISKHCPALLAVMVQLLFTHSR